MAEKPLGPDHYSLIYNFTGRHNGLVRIAIKSIIRLMTMLLTIWGDLPRPITEDNALNPMKQVLGRLKDANSVINSGRASGYKT